MLLIIIIITKNQWFDRKPFVWDFTAPGLPNPTRCLIDPNDIIIWIPIFINPLLLPLSLSNHLSGYNWWSQHYLTATACVDFPRETFLEGSRCRRRKINNLSASRSSLGSCYVARPIVHFVTLWLQTRHHTLSSPDGLLKTTYLKTRPEWFLNRPFKRVYFLTSFSLKKVTERSQAWSWARACGWIWPPYLGKDRVLVNTFHFSAKFGY